MAGCRDFAEERAQATLRAVLSEAELGIMLAACGTADFSSCGRDPFLHFCLQSTCELVAKASAEEIALGKEIFAGARADKNARTGMARDVVRWLVPSFAPPAPDPATLEVAAAALLAEVLKSSKPFLTSSVQKPYAGPISGVAGLRARAIYMTGVCAMSTLCAVRQGLDLSEASSGVISRLRITKQGRPFSNSTCVQPSGGATGPPSELWLPTAEQGDAKAQLNLGGLYHYGLGVEQDYVRAAELYQQAAEKGDANAHNRLGTLYMEGLGVEQDYVRAAELFRQAAEKGDATGLTNLGIMYFAGQGVEQDRSKSAELWQQGADQGQPEAQCRLGMLYQSGMGVKQEYDRAAALYQQAADQGHPEAQYRLGRVYLRDGSGASDTKARALFAKAAGQGHQKAAAAAEELRVQVEAEAEERRAQAEIELLAMYNEGPAQPTSTKPETKKKHKNRQKKPSSGSQVGAPAEAEEISLDEHHAAVRPPSGSEVHAHEGLGSPGEQLALAVASGEMIRVVEWFDQKFAGTPFAGTPMSPCFLIAQLGEYNCECHEEGLIDIVEQLVANKADINQHYRAINTKEATALHLALASNTGSLGQGPKYLSIPVRGLQALLDQGLRELDLFFDSWWLRQGLM